MKKIFLAAFIALSMSGCRSFQTSEASKVAYPLPPRPLSQFFREPIDGIYAVPESAASPMNPISHDVIVVSGGIIHLSCLHDGHIGTNNWNFVEFKPVLPSEDAFEQILPGTTEQGLEHRFGKPTREEFDYYPFIHARSGTTKNVTYSWFTLSKSSEFSFMQVHIYYKKTKTGEWCAEFLTWEKSGSRRL